jgi:cell division protein FtsL
MIRTLNFAFIAITGLVCLGLYRISEEARVANAELRATHAAIVREEDALAVLGAEWARVTQPARISALSERHLDLSEKPAPQLSSLTQLPAKNPPLLPEESFRNVNAIAPAAPVVTAPRPPAPVVSPAQRAGT